MPEVKIKLLGILNAAHRTSAERVLEPKYVAIITASDLSNLLKYKRIGKKHPYKIEPDSVIKIDDDIQRGTTDLGTLRQDEKKVDEIKDSLLGNSNGSPKIFLGTLVWNVREKHDDAFSVVTIGRDGKPPEYELRLKTKNIYLTDSAHRHIGICEAYRAFMSNSAKYKKFDPDFEFPVEIYNLDRTGEQLLFNELNSKQKKITKTKAQQNDGTSAVGVLKNAIIDYDQNENKLFYQNIEVNSNQNDRHTLATMSVFTSTIREMYPIGLINEAKGDEELRTELAAYYCNFFYKLSDTIRVKCVIKGKLVEVSPFENLYLEIIAAKENELADCDDEVLVEEELRNARQEATEKNQTIRQQDKINSNSFMKALCSIGGCIRKMKDWASVVELIQSKMILPADGKYFQASNEIMTRPGSSGHSMATLKEDGYLNVQVQTHTIKEIKNHFLDVLCLKFSPTLKVLTSGDNELSLNNHVVQLNSHSKTDVELIFVSEIASEVVVDRHMYRAKLVFENLNGVNWKEAERRGEKRYIPLSVERIAGYEHTIYGDSVAQYEARFRISFPVKNDLPAGILIAKLEIEYPGFSGESDTYLDELRCQSAE